MTDLRRGTSGEIAHPGFKLLALLWGGRSAAMTPEETRRFEELCAKIISEKDQENLAKLYVN